jgi:hypothetical protein
MASEEALQPRERTETAQHRPLKCSAPGNGINKVQHRRYVDEPQEQWRALRWQSPPVLGEENRVGWSPSRIERKETSDVPLAAPRVRAPRSTHLLAPDEESQAGL